jgi:RimJ/RimL family protein N-acetyltransferase
LQSGQADVTPDLELKRFQPEHYTEYASWFADPELNRRLGLMDSNWLAAVLSQPETEGSTWAVSRGAQLVAVVETALDPQRRLPAVITAIATRPALRRQGIGSLVLAQILSLHRSQGIREHLAFVAVDSPGARRCLEKAGFVLVTPGPDAHGYLTYRHADP